MTRAELSWDDTVVRQKVPLRADSSFSFSSSISSRCTLGSSRIYSLHTNTLSPFPLQR